MKKFFLTLTALLLTSCASPSIKQGSVPASKLYVAIEGENRIAVLDPSTRTVLKTIDLSERVGKVIHDFSPHNVQVAPDGKSVWVTANHGHGEHDEKGGHGSSAMPDHMDEESFRLIPKAYACHSADEENSSGAIEPCTEDEAPDEVIVIDPRTDEIIKRIPINVGVHLAHVVVTKDGSLAYATAQEKGLIYKIDAKRFEILNEVKAPTGSQPHGLRISPDGKTAYVALLQGKGLGVLDLRTDTLTVILLNGNAVQTGVTPDGRFTLVSLYDTKQLAILDTTTKKVTYIQLPRNTRGPIQMYPTPDSRFVYVADQGYYFNQPTGNRVYKIDLSEKHVVKEIPAGDAPHGVVVSPNGAFVYVTNLLTSDMSIIDTATDTEVGRIKVGKMPNGISLWTASSGGTP